MTVAENQHDEVRSLAWAVRDGTITDEGVARLDELVRSSTPLRSLYIEYMRLLADVKLDHAPYLIEQTLAQVFHQDDAEQNVTAAVAGDLQADKSRPVLGFLGNAWQQGAGLLSNTTWLSLGIAAMVIGALLTVLSFLPMPTYERSRFNCAYNTSTSGTGFQGVKGKFNFVARITGKRNCRWSADYLPPLRYAHLGVGRELKLDAGLLEITYKTGAKLVLEGPVEFTVDEANACRLDIGKLTAKVPQPAVGFTVETPNLTVVDLGTEFGVQADPSGETEVHVFQGEVDVASGSGPTAIRRRLSAGDAVRLDPNGEKLVEVQLDTKRFVRRSLTPSWADLTKLPIRDISVFDEFTEQEIPHAINPPGRAIDNDLRTFASPTKSGAKAPAILAFGLSTTTSVNGLRVFRMNDHPLQGGSDVDSVRGTADLVQLQILYTADDASVPLNRRIWIPVAGLATNPAAPVNANKIDPDTATVFGERHNASADGVFYELLFDAVDATGIGIRMVRDPTDPDVLDGGGYGNHLPVREIMLFFTKAKDN